MNKPDPTLSLPLIGTDEAWVGRCMERKDGRGKKRSQGENNIGLHG